MLSVIVFADLFKMLMIPNDSYWVAMKVVPLIIANFLGIYTNLSVCKLIDKTYMAPIFLSWRRNYIGFKLLLIPSMSYYGSAIATLAAYGT
jgi:hypothetical protein